MYFPYFRGKQYELIAIRESAERMSKLNFKPIIEPVRENFGGLDKTLEEIEKWQGEAIVVANPEFGSFRNNRTAIPERIKSRHSSCDKISLGLLLNESSTQGQIDSMLQSNGEAVKFLIHAGFSDAKALLNLLAAGRRDYCHLFMENQSSKLYRAHFKDAKRVLLRDGFRRLSNRDYPDQEFFSDLHATFREDGMDGFGDFLTVGNCFSETGGPAYTVAIHLTYVDDDRDGEMQILHFKSIRQDDPKDPAGKFLEALEKLLDKVNDQDSQLFRSTAVEEFVRLRDVQHFPGLGYVKKLSMKHHIETLADYFHKK